MIVSQINLVSCNEVNKKNNSAKLSMLLNATVWFGPIEGYLDSLWGGNNIRKNWHLIPKPKVFTGEAKAREFTRSTSTPLFDTEEIYLTFIQIMDTLKSVM